MLMLGPSSLPHLVCEDPEDEDEEEEEGIPEHEGKFGNMKGVAREKVSLLLGNYIFRKRIEMKNRSIIFSCNDCEAQTPKIYLSAIARITEEGAYELVEWPRSKDHSCWADGHQVLIRKAREEMISKEQNPARSSVQIYEEVRNSFIHSSNLKNMTELNVEELVATNHSLSIKLDASNHSQEKITSMLYIAYDKKKDEELMAKLESDLTWFDAPVSIQCLYRTEAQVPGT